MKIIFLDVDGVINCATTTQRHGGFIGIDPYMALLVDRIIQATGAKVVLSSTWRLDEESRNEVKKFTDFFATTPNFSKIRGNEIKQWLDENPGVEKYAILDDDTDMLPEQLPNFFKTSWRTGITQEISEAVIKHLNG